MTDETAKPAQAGTPSGRPIVYVREVDRTTLPEELRSHPGALHSLHDERGNQIAIAPDRGQAFALARRNNLQPISVH